MSTKLACAERILQSRDLQEILEFLLNIPKATMFPEELFKALERMKVKTKDLEKITKEVTATNSSH